MLSYNIEDILKVIDKYEVISFGLCNTLAYRILARGKDTYKLIEQLSGVKGFYDLRVKCHSIAMHKHGYIVSLDDIYNIMSEYGSIYSSLKEKEKEIELSIANAYPMMKQVFEYCIELGKKILIVSDTIFDKDFVKNLLTQIGYDISKCDLILSIETGKSKYEGTIFKDLIYKYGKSILNIGESNVDYTCAKQAGIDAIRHKMLIHQAEDCLYFNGYFLSATRKLNNMLISLSLGLGIQKWVQLGKPKKQNLDAFGEHLGYQYAGPIAFAFLSWIHSKAQEDGIDTLYFARHTNNTLYDIWNKLPYTIQARLITPGPRLYTLAALSITPNYNSFFKMIKKESFSTVNEFVDKLYLEEEDSDKLLKILQNSDLDIESLYKNSINFLRKIGRKELKSVKQSLRSEGLSENKKIALVDIVDLLETHASIELISKKSYNGYYALTMFDHYNNGKIEGYLFNRANSESKVKNISIELLTILLGTIAPNSSQVHFESSEKTTHAYSSEDKDLLYSIHKGAMNFIDDLLNKFEYVKDIAITPKDAFQYIELLTQKMNGMETQSLKTFYTID